MTLENKTLNLAYCKLMKTNRKFPLENQQMIYFTGLPQNDKYLIEVFPDRIMPNRLVAKVKVFNDH